MAVLDKSMKELSDQLGKLDKDSLVQNTRLKDLLVAFSSEKLSNLKLLSQLSSDLRTTWALGLAVNVAQDDLDHDLDRFRRAVDYAGKVLGESDDRIIKARRLLDEAAFVIGRASQADQKHREIIQELRDSITLAYSNLRERRDARFRMYLEIAGSIIAAATLVFSIASTLKTLGSI